MLYRKINLVVLCILVFSGFLSAQQLDQIGKKEGLKLSGGFGINQGLYFSDGVGNRYAPYNLTASGNLTASIYGISVPVSFAYSNRSVQYSSQPFNIVGISPSYKNLVVHAGYRNMTFSPYTLAGHNFLGGGVEWSKGGFKVMSMGGRLLKGVAYDSTKTTNLPTYMRTGGGLKLNYATGGNEISFITFFAKDKINSIEPIPVELNIRPQQNMVYSLGFKRKLLDNVSLNFEGAISGWTRNLNDEKSTSDQTAYQTAFFMPVNQSTVFYPAFKAGIDFSLSKVNLGFGYERVTPEYKTLGAYYMNNDFENITANASTALFKGKTNLAINIGLQHDDLNNTKQAKMNRFVGSANISHRFSERLQFNMAYSNFNSFTKVKPYDRALLINTAYERMDTLNFVQLTQSINAGLNYKLLENDNVVHNTIVTGSYQTASNKQGNKHFGNAMSSATLGYNLTFKKSGFNAGLSVNNNINYFVAGESVFAGLGLNSSLPVWNKKVKISLNGNISNNYEKGNLVARVYAVTNAYAMRMGKHHSISLSLRYSGRGKIKSSELATYNTTFNEFMGSLGYNFSF